MQFLFILTVFEFVFVFVLVGKTIAIENGDVSTAPASYYFVTIYYYFVALLFIKIQWEYAFKLQVYWPNASLDTWFKQY